jgi:hypothetical protein
VNADRHLLAVWNPSYASDAMHEHLALLLRLIGDLLRSNREAPGFDFSAVVLNLAKACEVQANQVVRSALAVAPLKSRQCKGKDRTLDIVQDGPLTLGTLAKVLMEEEGIRKELTARLRDGHWLVNQGAYALQELSRYRNPAAHTTAVPLAEAVRLRNHWLGVGCQGHLVRLSGGFA